MHLFITIGSFATNARGRDWIPACVIFPYPIPIRRLSYQWEDHSTGPSRITPRHRVVRIVLEVHHVLDPTPQPRRLWPSEVRGPWEQRSTRSEAGVCGRIFRWPPKLWIRLIAACWTYQELYETPRIYRISIACFLNWPTSDHRRTPKCSFVLWYFHWRTKLTFCFRL